MGSSDVTVCIGFNPRQYISADIALFVFDRFYHTLCDGSDGCAYTGAYVVRVVYFWACNGDYARKVGDAFVE